MLRFIIVEIEKGVWLANGDGDPCRTLKKKSAKIFGNIPLAMLAIEAARTFRPFKDAIITDYNA